MFPFPTGCGLLYFTRAGSLAMQRILSETSTSKPALQYLPSIEEYLQLELVSPVRHEYLAGRIFAMTRDSPQHNRIAGWLYNAIDRHLGAGPCEAYISDVKLRFQINTEEYVYYPDVLVSCGPEESGQYVLHPKLIIEVLSPLTESIDRREKALLYRSIPTLQEYATVSQDDAHVTVQRRAEQWVPALYSRPEDIIEFHSLGLSIPLAELYASHSAANSSASA